MNKENNIENKYVTDEERERGKRIKKLFDSLGMTGEKFDEKYGLKIIDDNGEEKDNPDGISYNTMKTHFAGKGLNIKNLVKYAKIFGVSTDYILFGIENNAPKKEEPKTKNKIELKKINEAIVLLMDVFGDDCVSYFDENINCAEHMEIEIINRRIIENIKSIKNLRNEIEKSKNEDTKRWLSYGLLSTINAENMVVESVENEIFVYDKTKEIIFHGYDYNSGARSQMLKSCAHLIDRGDINIFELITEDAVIKRFGHTHHCEFGYDERGHYISKIIANTPQNKADDEEIPF